MGVRSLGDVIAEEDRREAVYNRIYNEAIEAAAKIADEWTHHGDPAEAMYASPRIRDRILRLKKQTR